MSKSNPFRTKRLQPAKVVPADAYGSASMPSTSTSTASKVSLSQSKPTYGVNVIANAFFGPELDESSPVTSTHQIRHDRPHKTVRIASPPVSVEGVAAGSGSGTPTPTFLSPVLESIALTTTDTAAISATVAAGRSSSLDVIAERLVQPDPNAPFQNLTPRPGSPPPEPIADTCNTADAAAIRDTSAAVRINEKQDEGPGQKQENYLTVDAVAGTMVRTTSLRTSETRPPPPSTRKQRHTMDVDSFKRMLLTGDAAEEGQESTTDNQATQRKSGGMDVDDFKRMLLTGDPSGHAGGPSKEQTSSSLSTPAVPLPRRTSSIRQKLASNEDSRKTSGTVTTGGGGEKPPPPPPPPPPRARHGRAVSMKESSTSAANTPSDDSKRSSMGLSRSVSVNSALSTLSTETGASSAPSPPSRRMRSTAPEADQPLPPQQHTKTSPLQTTVHQLRSPPLSRSPSILSSVDEPPRESVSVPPISDEPTRSARQQGQRLPPPTPPIARRTSQYRRSVSGSNGSVTTTGTVQAQQRMAMPPPPPSPRPRARVTSGSSIPAVSDEEVVELGVGTASSRSSLSLSRNGPPPPPPPPPFEEGWMKQLDQQETSSANNLDITPTSIPPEQQTATPPSTSSSTPSKRMSLPPRPPPPRRRPGASSSISQAAVPSPPRISSSSKPDDPSLHQLQQKTGDGLPSQSCNSYTERRIASGSSSSRGPPPPPPPPASQAAREGRLDGTRDGEKGEGEDVGYTSPSHAADVLADLTRLQADVDAYRMKNAT